MVESQSKGALRFQMLAWILGAVQSIENMRRLNDDDFVNKLISCIDSIIKWDLSD